MPQYSRPSIDSVTAWRIEQIGKAENRSMANVIKQCVAESWERRQDAKLAAAMGRRDDAAHK